MFCVDQSWSRSLSASFPVSQPSATASLSLLGRSTTATISFNIFVLVAVWDGCAAAEDTVVWIWSLLLVWLAVTVGEAGRCCCPVWWPSKLLLPAELPAAEDSSFFLLPVFSHFAAAIIEDWKSSLWLDSGVEEKQWLPLPCWNRGTLPSSAKLPDRGALPPHSLRFLLTGTACKWLIFCWIMYSMLMSWLNC